MATPPKKKEFHILPKVINGGLAGLIGVSCVFPLDMVKTRFQNQQIGSKGERMYNSIPDAFKKIYKSEGFFGMYRGAKINLILITPEKAIKLSSNDLFRYHLSEDDGYISIPKQMLAGGMAGLCQTSVTCPMELLKIQMQDSGRVAAIAKAEGRTVEKPSVIKIIKNLFKEKGIFGLYRGISANMCRDVGFSLIFFPLFAALNDLGPKRQDGSNDAVFWTSFLSGLTAGSVAAFLDTPFDVMKTRLQLINKGTGERHYTGLFDVATSVFKHEGFRAFFKGGMCRVMVISPLFGIAQTIYYLGVGEYLLGMKKT